MSNYVNLTLDTVGPSGVSLLINGDETKTTSTAVSLAIGCSDEELGSYQMKIWGIADVLTEDVAVWETYRATKTVTLPSGDGIKTVYVKVRDDVWNESDAVSDTVTLYEKVPTVQYMETNISRLSLVSGKNVTSGAFWFDEAIDAVRIAVVQDVNATYDDPANVIIPKTNGSVMSDDNDCGTYSSDILEGGGYIDSIHAINFSLYSADIAAASPGDGVKIIKAFVRSAETGNWSV